ncbi:MAG: hypothetical protein ACD_56C00065G0001 [uncultured bacterium]|nr:MAG: hypothetical protein ACD_56C00065G0001 [uncultured bacterium]
MIFHKTLGELKNAIDRQIQFFLDLAIEEVKGEDPLMMESLKHVKKIALSGGKRVRGALLCQSYLGFGGKDKRKIVKAAAAIELIHLFLLIHDDIIDRGRIRHGQPTLHLMLAKKFQKKLGESEALHFGNSMAIIVGDMLYAIAIKIISEAGFEQGATLSALSKLQSVVNTTIVGQSQDIGISYKSRVTEDEVLSMYENKTARYTFEGPLHIGALLAGCSDKKIFELLSEYAINLGIAFQIQDDILGVFSSEEKTGKSSSSDIEEGKKTLLVIKAQSLAAPDEMIKMNALLGKKSIAKKELKSFRDVLIRTGSLEYNKDMASRRIEVGKREIEKIIMLPAQKKFLLGLAEYLEKREI